MGGFRRFAAQASLHFQASSIVGLLSISTHGPLGSSFLGLPYRILSINHKKGTT